MFGSDKGWGTLAVKYVTAEFGKEFWKNFDKTSLFGITFSR